MSGVGRGRVGVGPGVDATAQRALNAEAPRVDGLWGRIAELFQPYRAPIALTIVLVVVGAALSVLPPLLTAEAFDVGLFPPSGGPDLGALAWIVAAMVVIVVVSTLLGVWQTYLTSRVGNSVMGALRIRLFSHLQSMELGFFTRTKTGIIQSRLQNDVGGVSSVLSNTISSVLANTVTVLAALVAMLLLSWQLTIVAVVLMPFLVIAQRRVGQVRARIATQTQESLSDMTAITQETLSVSGILLSKSFNRQDAEIARYAAENDNQVRLQIRQQMSGQWFFALVGIILASIPAVVYLISGWLVLGGATDISAGTVVAFTTVQARLLFPLLALMRVGLDLQTSAALFARIFEYLDLRPAVQDRPDARNAPLLGKQHAAVEFRDVTFRYPDQEPSEKPTLDEVSFRIEPGQFAAFVGPSGAGKTTIGSLIPRFYIAEGGVIAFGGDDVRMLRGESLLDQLGIVSQDTYLFHATITENLRYARPDATDEQIAEACRKANIHDRIVSFADGYDTVVGERGYRLSGGEKQRVAIARVLLKDPPVLILDEATSALDTVSERIVQTALDSAARGRTTIAIAHRLSTIAAADVIHVLVDGRIVESGTHPELVRAGGVYAVLYAEQNLTEA